MGSFNATNRTLARMDAQSMAGNTKPKLTESDFCQPESRDRRPVLGTYRGVQIMRLVHRSSGTDAFRVAGEYYHSYALACAAIDAMEGVA